MLKIATVPTFKTKVEFETVGADGRPVRHHYTAIFKGLDLEQYQALMDRAREAADGDALVVGEVLQGWEGVGDDAGSPLAFNPDNCDALMRMMGARAATVRAFIKALTGAKEKN
jgi:hypothetical protein